MLSGIFVGATLIGAASALATCDGTEKYSQNMGVSGDTTFYVQEGDPQGVEQNVSLCVNIPANAVDCVDPRATLVYENIDHSSRFSEYLDVYYDGNQFANCVGSQYNCFNFTTCIDYYDLSGVGLNTIPAGSSASFDIKMGPSIDTLCVGAAGVGIAINAEFTIECSNPIICSGASTTISHIIDNSGATPDATQCGLGCLPATDIHDCNSMCLIDPACQAYLYTPSERLECAIYDTKTPVSRGTNELMCEPCQGGAVPLRANAANELVDGPSNSNWAEINDVNIVELLAINASVSAVVSLAMVSSCIACYFMCNQRQKKYVSVGMEEAEEDAVINA